MTQTYSSLVVFLQVAKVTRFTIIHSLFALPNFHRHQMLAQ